LKLWKHSKLKIDRRDAKEFLRFIPKGWWMAMDEGGKWFAYQEKPYPDEDEWCYNLGDNISVAKLNIDPVEDWTQSLMQNV
jgi:hypothetical protein